MEKAKLLRVDTTKLDKAETLLEKAISGFKVAKACFNYIAAFQ